MKELHVKVQRFDPKKDKVPRVESYTVSVNDGARVLHVLHAIHDTIDPTLAYRYCCGSGQCGSCAVRVNGEPVLACMEEAQDGITIAPLNLPVRQDLVVDLLPKIEQIASLKPGADCKLPTKEEIDAIKPLRDCIECLACVSVCPAMDVTKFLGPTAMRQEMRLALDPRDTGDWVPDAIRDGLFNCTSCQACYKVCPKKIKSREKRSRNSGRSQTSGVSPCPGTGRSRRSSKRPAAVLSGVRRVSWSRSARPSSRSGRRKPPWDSLSAACTTCASSSRRSTRSKCSGETASGLLSPGTRSAAVRR